MDRRRDESTATTAATAAVAAVAATEATEATEATAAVAAAAQSGSAVAILLEHIPDAVAITSCAADGIYLAVNDAYCELAACTREELVGRPSDLHWANPVQEEAARELMQRGVPIDDLHCRFRNARGEDIDTSLSARRVVIDGELRLIVSRRDVRRRSEIEQRLRASEERWRFAVEGHGDALWDWSVDTQTIFRSPRWLAMLHLPEAAATVSIEEHGAAFATEDLPAVSVGFRELLAGRVDEIVGECRLRRADGATIWVGYRCRTMARNAAGMPARVIGTCRDITARKERQRALDAQLERISHSGRLLALGEMASAIAHEINQPLAVVASYAGVLVRKTVEQPELRELAVRIENEVLRAGQVVWRMRQFSRHGELCPATVDLRDLVRESLEWTRLDNRAQGVAFELDLPAEPAPARVDRVLIEQVLLNLLRNALQSMSETQEERVVAVRLRRDALRGEMVVEIADRGCGLPSQVAVDVYQPFFTTRADGLGLGLSIAHSIVARHGGRMWSAAREEGGTVFSFSVPAVDASAQAEKGRGDD